jgi:hypothetical protein
VISPTLAALSCHDDAVATWELSSARVRFERAANAFTTVVAKIGRDQWDQRGLGQSSVRDLVGQGSRAFTTIESCLAVSEGESGAPDLRDVPAYYRALAATRWEHATAARPVSVAALGAEPSVAVAATVARVRDLVRASTDRVAVMTPVGTLRLLDYLVTRTFEITVHTLDLARALGVPAPDVLADPVGAGLGLVAALGEDRPPTSDLFLLLTGHGRVQEGWRTAA